VRFASTIPETESAVNAARWRGLDFGAAMHCEHLFRMAKRAASAAAERLILRDQLANVAAKQNATGDETGMSIFDLSGRVAVVTGGNGGIGLGIAQALAEAGCTVSIWGRNADKNAQAVASITGKGGNAEARVCDVADAASVKAAMKATLDAFGRVDGCFANAGIGGGGRHAFIDRTEEDWRKMFATNLDGVFHVFQAAARHMTERAAGGDAFGRLVATSSLASLFGTARNEHYAATKSAINALVRALAVELARHGVTANAILPGWIKSDMTSGIMANEKFVANVMPRIPVRRFGEPSDFGGIAVYLMSKASSYHTADTILIDGGYTAF
jgi:NAD(P)-dependent dehydrogenase (short-subunit alcohol dehydrogenase family)